MAFENLGRHADRFAQRWMRMNGLSDVRGLATHFNSETDFADEIAGVGTNNAAADHAMGRLIEQKLRKTLVASIRYCTT